MRKLGRVVSVAKQGRPRRRSLVRFALPIARIDFVLRKHLPVLAQRYELAKLRKVRAAKVAERKPFERCDSRVEVHCLVSLHARGGFLSPKRA
jgi:hypothetical protein